MTSSEAKNKYKHFLRVGDLKKQLENYPDDALVVAQRVEDRYYEGVDISGITGKLPDGTWGILPEGSKATRWETIKKPDHLYPEYNQEYTPVWGICQYKDDTNCLFLDLHY